MRLTSKLSQKGSPILHDVVKIDDLSTITDRDYKKLNVSLIIALMDGISQIDQNDLMSTLLAHSIVVSKNAS